MRVSVPLRWTVLVVAGALTCWLASGCVPFAVPDSAFGQPCAVDEDCGDPDYFCACETCVPILDEPDAGVPATCPEDDNAFF